MSFGSVCGDHLRTSAKVALTIGYLSFGPAHGTVRQVALEYPTIQGAVSAAVAGDTVLVAPGTYANFDFLGKRLVVKSVSGPDVTTVSSSPAVSACSTIEFTEPEIPPLRS